MDIQNLGYALTQVAHNFGASAVTGGAAAALWLKPRPEADRLLAWLVLTGWCMQVASGAVFGAISFCYYGKFPDISPVATGALAIKVSCAATAFLLASFYLFRGAGKSASWRRNIWLTLAILGATALSAAAFLRWFS